EERWASSRASRRVPRIATRPGAMPMPAKPLPQLLIGLLCLLAGTVVHAADAVPVLDFEVVAEYPHDSAAFTQGLTVDAGALFEGTGRNGASSLRRVDLATGEILQRRNLGVRYFGE